MCPMGTVMPQRAPMWQGSFCHGVIVGGITASGVAVGLYFISIFQASIMPQSIGSLNLLTFSRASRGSFQLDTMWALFLFGRVCGREASLVRITRRRLFSLMVHVFQ